MTSDERLIECLDKLVALKPFPRDDRLRCAKEELRGLRDVLPALLDLPALAGALYPQDDGLRWGYVDANEGCWKEMDKLAMLKFGLGPPPFYYTSPDGTFYPIVHEPGAPS